MTRLRIFLLIACTAIICTAWAKPISENQARSIAASFMASHHMPSTRLQRVTPPSSRIGVGNEEASSTLYIFNADEQQGFVIIAGDDRVSPVLGFSQQGTFDADEMPPALLEMLDCYHRQIEALGQGAQAAPSHISGSAIAPMVKCQWSQSSPYNSMMPYLNNSQCVTGCVTTAMAQIMYYYKYPAQATQTIPSYTTRTNSIYMPSLNPTLFKWSDMQDNYLTNNTTSSAAVAVATLMKYCAQGAQIDFKDGVSSGYSINVLSALINYFGYKASGKYHMRDRYSAQEWESLIYSELAANRPVYYSASKLTGGHAFVCDGFDGNGLFHINWGWNGLSDGYYAISVLNPDAQSTGGADGDYGYLFSQAIITGIEPGYGASTPDEMTIANLVINNSVTTRSSTSGNFQVTLSGEFHNTTPRTTSFNYGYGLYSGNTLINRLLTYSITDIQPSYYINLQERTLSFGSGISNATYRIVPIYTQSNSNNWKPCVGSDRNYIEVTISNNQCTIKGHGSAATRNYRVNGTTTEGTKHPNRPITVSVNLTNQGDTQDDILYMFVGGNFATATMVNIPKGQTGNATFLYTPTSTGTKSLMFSWDKEGDNPIATSSVLISPMPTASLSATVSVPNLNNGTIHSNTFDVVLTITNNGTTDYDEDIMVRLYKHIYDNYGSTVETQSKRLHLAKGKTTQLQFSLQNVKDGWEYFVKSFYFSEGQSVSLKGTPFYTMDCPGGSTYNYDVNNDGEMNIADVNTVIDVVLGGLVSGAVRLACDVNKDGEINIADVNVILDYILTH